MQIKLPLELKVFISDKKILFPVKVLSLANKGTNILIGGRKIFVPFFLDKSKNYIAKIKNGKLEIQISKQVSINSKLKNISNKNTDKLLKEIFKGEDSENNNNFFSIFYAFVKDSFTKQKDSCENKQLRRFIKKKDSFFFLFDMNLFACESSVALNINESRNVKVVLKFTGRPGYKPEIIKSKFYDFFKSKSLSALVYIAESENEFKAKISSIISESKLDINA